MLIHGPLLTLPELRNPGIDLMGAPGAGCSSTAPPFSNKPPCSLKGSVRLEEVADWEFEASHPSSIDVATRRDLLRAVVIAEAQTDMSNLPVDGSKPMTVFSDEDVCVLLLPC